MALMCNALADQLEKTSSPSYPLAKKISQGIDRALDQVRKLARGLVPVAVDPEGLQNALANLAEEAAERKEGISCHHECGGDVCTVDGETATQLFLIAREAVTNAIKHGAMDLKDLGVSLTSQRGTITLTVRDDGPGFDVHCADVGGLGLKIMDYRARLIGAHLNVISSEDGGTLVKCTLERSGPDGDVPAHHRDNDGTNTDRGRPSRGP
jgi:two-component system CheB/CheR fusion protein